jgi:nitronate monooxygenase
VSLSEVHRTKYSIMLRPGEMFGKESKVVKRFDLTDLAVPVIVAPMADGPSTPELAAAATNAGALGMMAGACSRPRPLPKTSRRLAVSRRDHSGFNLFVPQPSVDTPAAFTGYARGLTADAARYRGQLGQPRYHDDGWSAKLDVVLDTRPDLVSFTQSPNRSWWIVPPG